MDSHFVVSALVRDANQQWAFGCLEWWLCYGDSNITMNMTVAEQGERGKLVLELSQKLTSEPLKKMVIRFGT